MPLFPVPHPPVLAAPVPAAGRMYDIDRAKGLAILLVVFGHLVARQDPAGVGWYEPLRILVYLFHMPFFMYLSGYVAFRSGAARTPLPVWPRLARRRAERLLLPFLLFGLVILAGKFVASALVPVDNLPPDLWHGLRALLWDTGGSPATSVWYLGALFVYSLATPLLVRSGRFLWVIALALFALPAPPLVYADRICTYFVFFVAGGMAAEAGRRWLDAVDRWRWLSAACFAALLVAVAAGLFPVDFNAGTRSGGYKALMLGATLLAIPAIHGLVRAPALAGSRALLWLGGASFAIYLLNTICIGVAKGVLLRVVSWDGPNFLPFAATLMLAGTLGPVLVRKLVFRRVSVLDRLTA
jgi:fucose 4-O-acetylase-like acetyltransferase